MPWAFGMHFEVDTSEVEPKDINGPAGGLHDSLVLPWGKIEPRLILGVFFHGEDAQVADMHLKRQKLIGGQAMHRAGHPARQVIRGDGNAVPREKERRLCGRATPLDRVDRVHHIGALCRFSCTTPDNGHVRGALGRRVPAIDSEAAAFQSGKKSVNPPGKRFGGGEHERPHGHDLPRGFACAAHGRDAARRRSPWPGKTLKSLGRH